MSNMNNYCIVGYGKHSSTKLIPALEKLKKKIMGIVSSQTNALKTNYKIFKNLDDAILFSDNNTVFIIANPPHVHFSQIKKILNAGRNIFVEKPIFISSNEALISNKLISDKNIFVVETMMYKYNHLYKKFLDYWLENKSNIIKLECVFLLPSLPSNTFRDQSSIFCSPLYDIGCYFFSLLVDLDINCDNFELKEISYKKNKITKMIIYIRSNKLKLQLKFGVDKKYENFVKLFLNNNIFYEFSPFFYGREKIKTITSTKSVNSFKDVNAFENMFQNSNEFWCSNQKKRFINIIKINKILEKIVNKINTNKKIKSSLTVQR